MANNCYSDIIHCSFSCILYRIAENFDGGNIDRLASSEVDRGNIDG